MARGRSHDICYTAILLLAQEHVRMHVSVLDKSSVNGVCCSKLHTRSIVYRPALSSDTYRSNTRRRREERPEQPLQIRVGPVLGAAESPLVRHRLRLRRHLELLQHRQLDPPGLPQHVHVHRPVGPDRLEELPRGLFVRRVAHAVDGPPRIDREAELGIVLALDGPVVVRARISVGGRLERLGEMPRVVHHLDLEDEPAPPRLAEVQGGRVEVVQGQQAGADAGHAGHVRRLLGQQLRDGLGVGAGERFSHLHRECRRPLPRVLLRHCHSDGDVAPGWYGLADRHPRGIGGRGGGNLGAQELEGIGIAFVVPSQGLELGDPLLPPLARHATLTCSAVSETIW
mmetsp:Transcript_32611/g.96115  ORF Transcript_32611/g.96115 Transcript_32611/m.96115 type:complete len:342 (-) Transcript_32611:18-1043(-)